MCPPCQPASFATTFSPENVAVCFSTPASDQASALHRALALPADVHLAVLTLDAAAGHVPQPALPPQLLRAGSKRQNEYRAGRCCAALALQAAGAGTIAPGMGDDRLPVWPQGWIGNISHGGGQAVAVVAPAQAGVLLGIDVERLIEPEAVDGIAALVAFGDELGRLTAHCASAAQKSAGVQPGANTARIAATALTLLFSAKEALYKALYPDVRRFVDFSGARLTGLSAQGLTLELTEDWHPLWRSGARFAINYVLRGDHVFSVCHSGCRRDGEHAA